ncbi:ciliary neurotrophic factor receptor subunit alpha-like [Pseudonaja textilis]|uniref:ciliary neurotrophic factor receptor subunit alpha-like n=1 Tax=Pseudonaja textilis TaxID=8673 RepID=UPI000EA9DD8D|nr:ciliary neurotrophic factor receptor subunit alpha-like [Pseudonaja textilis]
MVMETETEMEKERLTAMVIEKVVVMEKEKELEMEMVMEKERLTDIKDIAPPREPSLMCRSNNYPIGFYCSWHLPSPTYIPDTFNITIIHDSHDPACAKEGTRGIQKTVKPDPPENVIAKPIPNNARRLLVTWQYPSSWPDPDSFPLKFFLRYRPLIIDQWQHVELSDGTSHIITDAYAGKEYIIQVAAKDNEIGTWSDWSVAVHATPWTEEPKHLTTEAQGAETTTSSTSTFEVPPTTKMYDSEEQSSDEAVSPSVVPALVLVAFALLLI